MIYVLRHLALVLTGAALLATWSQASAQQQFTLGEDDTWKATATAVDPATPEGQLEAARQALANREFSRAQRLADQWIDRNELHPMLPQAYLIRADAKLGNNDDYEALFDYEYIARVYPGSDVFVIALQRELEIAKMYAAGRLRKLWGLRFIGASDEAEELFIRIQERLPGSSLAEDAGMSLADFYFERRKMSLAAEAYDLFLENYPRSSQLPKARRRLIFAHLASFKGPEFDAAGLYEARARLVALRRFQPVEAEQIGATGLITRIDESDAMKMLQTARWYLRVNDPIAAEMTIRRLVKRYESSIATADALRLIPEILPRLPERVLRNAPDYRALRLAVLGVDDGPQDRENGADTGTEVSK